MSRSSPRHGHSAPHPAPITGHVPPTPREWLSFALQCAVVVAVQEMDDSVRGRLWPPSAATAASNARHLVALECDLHLFVEPAIQRFFVRPHDLLVMTVSGPMVADVMNAAYIFLHVFVTLAIGLWVFSRHRDCFPRLRNVMIAATLLCLVVYEVYPMTPPRLTPGLTWEGHPFQFQDTLRPVIGSGRLTGIPLVYNPLSAMPSLHVAWAVAVGLALVVLARGWLVKSLGLVYPLLVTAITIITANHYLADTLVAAAIVALAWLFVSLLDRWTSTVRLSPSRGDGSKSTRVESAPHGARYRLHARWRTRSRGSTFVLENTCTVITAPEAVVSGNARVGSGEGTRR